MGTWNAVRVLTLTLECWKVFATVEIGNFTVPKSKQLVFVHTRVSGNEADELAR